MPNRQLSTLLPSRDSQQFTDFVPHQPIAAFVVCGIPLRVRQFDQTLGMPGTLQLRGLAADVVFEQQKLLLADRIVDKVVVDDNLDAVPFQEFRCDDALMSAENCPNRQDINRLPQTALLDVVGQLLKLVILERLVVF